MPGFSACQAGRGALHSFLYFHELLAVPISTEPLSVDAPRSERAALDRVSCSSSIR